MKTKIFLFISALFFFFAQNSSANDSLAKRESAGGLVFLKSEDIRMVQEELEISPGTIRVHYWFRNESDKDIRAMIAFPLPTYPWDWSSIRSDKPEPIKRIFTKVNGNAVETTKDRKAVLGSKDITDELRKIGLTDNQIFEAVAHCDGYNVDPWDSEQEIHAALIRCGYKPQQIETLTKRELWGWWIDETKLWEYVFPAHQEVDVVHEYTPHTGGVVNGFSEDACVDESTSKAIDRKFGNSGYYTRDVGYILKTANNWKGPISDFKLIINKDSADQLVSLCFPGKPKKVGNSIVFSIKDFVPMDDLVVFFISGR